MPWLSTGYVEIQRARCLTTLGDHQQAAQLFRDAIGDIPRSLRRDRGVYIAREAMAHANANDPEQAADAGMRALAIPQITHSGRITTELRRLDTALRRWKTVPRAAVPWNVRRRRPPRNAHARPRARAKALNGRQVTQWRHHAHMFS